MKKQTLVLFILLLALTTSLLGQEFSGFYSYVLNPANINPAYIGKTDKVQGVLVSRSQYADVIGSPKNIMAGISGPVFMNQAAGLRVINDIQGAFNLTRADFTYAQKFYMHDDSYIRFGLSMGLLNRTINVSDIQTNTDLFDEDDPTLNGDGYNFNRFVAGFGMLYEIDHLEIGFSAPHIVENANSINSFLVGMASYDYEINSDWAVKPTVIYQNIPNSKNKVDILAKGIWKQKISVILGYTNTSRLKGGLGVDLSGFGVSYLYGMTTGDLKSLSASTNELMITIAIQRKAKRFSSSKMDEELDHLIEYTTDLLEIGDKYGKDFITEEIEKIYVQLDEVIEENTNKNNDKLAFKIQKVEHQIMALVKKYNLEEK
jgi:type IX secretion system PorP/SprF family membrane protein